MLRTLVVILITITLLVPAASVAGQDKAKTDTQTKTDAKSVAGSEGANGKKTADSKDKGEGENESSLLRQRSLLLLRQAGDEAAGIKDGRMASQVQSKAADLLWELDKETARKYFESAFDIAVRYYRDLAPDKAAGTGPVISQGDYRMQVIGLAGRRDPELGRKFTDQYVEEKHREQQDATLRKKASNDRDTRLFGNIDPVANDLLESATALFETDREMALEMARRALSMGIPTSSAFFFIRLAVMDQPSADQLYRFAIDHVGNDPGATAGQLLMLSAYPFGDKYVYVNDGTGTSMWGFEVPKNFRVYPEMIHQFFGVAQTVLGRSAELDPTQSSDDASRVGTALFAARILRPSISRFEPELSESWDALITRLSTQTTLQSRDGIDKGLQNIEKRKSPPSTIDKSDRIADWLSQAEKATDPAKKNNYYQLAAIEIDSTGDTDRALTIADKISDAEFRSKTRTWIYFEAASRAIKEKKYDDAHRYASKIDEVDQSAYLYFTLAEAVLKDKDRPRATELLDESLRRVSGAVETNAKLNSLLGIAYVYSTFDPLRGFEAASEAVRTANKLPDYTSENALLVRNSRGPGQGGSNVVSGLDNYNLGRTLTILARTDFDRSLLLTQSLESKLMRLNAVISVTASVLENKKTIAGH